MSLQPQTIPPVPEATVRVAGAAFPKGNLYLRLRDELSLFCHYGGNESGDVIILLRLLTRARCEIDP